MMKKITLLFLLFSSFIFSQNNWRFKMISQEHNFKEIKETAEIEIAKLYESTDRKDIKTIKQFERWNYFWANRLDESNTFGNPMRDYKTWKSYLRNNAKAKRDFDNEKNWISLGPTQIPESETSFYAGLGRLNVLQFDPNNSNTIWVGSPGGGIWKSQDGGLSWTSKGDNVPNLGVSDIAIDPNNSNIIYAATGDFDGSQNRSIGVIKSTDGGENWNLTGLNFDITQSFFIAHIIIDPNNSNILFATTNNAIYKSSDAGVSWAIKKSLSGGFNDILFKKGEPTIMYATSNSGDFYTSSNSGSSWTKAPYNFASGRLDISLTEDDSNFIFAITSSTFYKSTNSGTTWTTVPHPAQFNSQGNYNQTLTIAPNNKNLILVGGVNGYRTLNGGLTWQKYLDGYWQPGDPFFYVHSDHHDLKFLPGSNTTVFSANDGGLHKGDVTQANPWTDLSSGLTITQYYKLAVTPQKENYILGGAQDNDITQYDGNKWINRNYGTDGVEALWNYSNSNIAWTCSQFGYVERTTNGWATAPSVLNTPSGNSFVWPLEIHPTIPTILFGGFSNIYKSTNSGTTWTNLGAPSTAIKVITIAPSNPNIIYATSNSAMYKTINGGNNWTTVSQPSFNKIASIAISDINPNEIYIVYEGYSSGQKVFKSTNGGTNWENISGTLPNIPMHKILYQTASDGILFLASDIQVFYKDPTDEVSDWKILGNGLPNVIVNDMEIFYGEEPRLRVATFGRGIWDIPLDKPLSTPQFDAKLFSVYPNPTNGKFHILFPKKYKRKEIIIYNQIGGVVYHKTTNQMNLNMDLGNIAPGLYLIKITSEGRHKIEKLMIQ